MKKVLALVLAGSMIFAMPAFAACGGSASPSASTTTATTTVATPVVASTPVSPVIAAAETIAKAENMSVGEVMNNAIVETTGIDKTTVEPVAAGQGAIIDGKKTNYTVCLGKANAATVKEAKAAYAGTLVNVVSLKNVPKAGSVKISLYNKKVAAGDKIVVMQKVNGVWVQLEASVRAEHIDVTLQGNGPVAIFRG